MQLRRGARARPRPRVRLRRPEDEHRAPGSPARTRSNKRIWSIFRFIRTGKSSGRNRLRDLSRPALLFCAFFIVFGSLAVVGYPHPWGAALFNVLTTSATLPFVLWISYELDRRSAASWRRAWAYMVALCVFCAVISEPVGWLVAQVTSEGGAHHPKLFMLRGATENFLYFLFWSFLHVFIRSGQRAMAQERRIAAVREDLLRDENEALVYALNPDFVVRALARIGSSLEQRDHAAAAALVIALAEQMRETLSSRDGARAGARMDVAASDQVACEPVEPIDPESFRRYTLVTWGGLLGVIFCVTPFASHGAYATFLGEFGPEPLVGALWCLLMQRVLDRRSGQETKRLHALAAGLAVLGLCVSSAALFLSFWAVGRLHAAYTVSTIPGLEFYYMAPALFAWTTAYFVLDARRREVLRLRGEAEIREAALRARNAVLRQQINPHFLFNVLNALYVLVLDRELERAKKMVAAVRRFMDRAGDPAQGDLVDLSSELATQDAYLEIERVRFGERLRVRMTLEGEVRAAKVPHLILQPLVENAVKHGLARTSEPVLVEICAARDGGELVLQVKDSGARETRLRPSGLGLGLRIVEARLRGFYGPAARLAYERLDPRGFLAEVRVPLVTGPAHDVSGSAGSKTEA